MLFLFLAILGWAMWIAIARGYNGEKEGDSAAWLTCFTFWAPASYLLVLGKRSWRRRGAFHTLLLLSATVFTSVELMLIAQSIGRLPSILRPKAELPVWIGIPFFYGAMGSLAATPLFSLIVFLDGRRAEGGISEDRA